MADKEFIFEIKANISGLQKDLKASKEETQDLKDNFGAFGITVGGVKEKFKDFRKIVSNGFKQIAIQSKLALNGFKLMFGGEVRTGAKVLFNVIKTGVAATGIGLLVVAFVSLVTYFTKTKKGAELLERAFTGIGAAVDVIVDRVSKFGGAIVKLFQGDTKGALQDVKDTFTGIGDEIQREVDLMIELKRQSQELRDSDRELRVETAQRRAEIEGLKLVAEDLTRSEQERLEAAQSAFDIENDLLEKRLSNAEEAVRIQQEQIKTSENLEEDLDKLADLEVSLADIRAESTTKQIELNNKINGIKREAEAKEIAALKEIIDLEKQRTGELEKVVPLHQQKVDLSEKIQLADNKELDNYLQGNKDKKDSNDAIEDAKRKTIEMTAKATMAIAGEGSAVGKAVSVAMAIMNTKEAITAALGAKPYGPWNIAQAIATGVFGMAQVRDIMSTPIPSGGSGGGVSAPSIVAPRTEVASGAFTLGGGMEPEPARAFVVSDDITDSQNKLANIRRRATI